CSRSCGYGITRGFAYCPRNLVYRLFQDLEERLRIKANPERHNDQGNKRRQFPRTEVLQFLVFGVGYSAEENPLIEPEEVRSSQGDTWNCPRSPSPVLHERSLQDGEFAYESVEQRQTHRRQKHDHGDGGVNRHDIRDPAILGDFARMTALIKDT